MMNRGGGSAEFAVCIHNGEYDVDLVVGEIYRVMRADIRILDESGEDYLYPRRWFVPVALPLKAKKALIAIY